MTTIMRSFWVAAILCGSAACMQAQIFEKERRTFVNTVITTLEPHSFFNQTYTFSLAFRLGWDF